MTTTAPRVLGVGGSLRRGSSSSIALRVALDDAARAGADTELAEVGSLDLPPYDDRSDPSTYPDQVHAFVEKVRGCDGLILASPVYHGTMSGSIKNALDFLELLADDDPPWLGGKVAGLITVSGGRPRGDAILSLEIACRALHAWTVPVAVSIPDRAFAEGELRDDRIRNRLERLAHAVVNAAESLRT